MTRPRRRTSLRIRCWQALGTALAVAILLGAAGAAGELVAALLRGRLR